MDRNNGRILAAELVGTAVLVMCGPGSAILAADVIGILGVALAFGLALLVMAYVIGPISGCNINPAVTLGLLLTKKIDTARAVFSWIGQVVGGIIGALIIFVIANSRDGFERGGFASNGWDRDGFSSLGATIVVEIVFTAIFVWVVLTTATPRFPPASAGWSPASL
jgi:aquaporin Z